MKLTHGIYRPQKPSFKDDVRQYAFKRHIDLKFRNLFVSCMTTVSMRYKSISKITRVVENSLL